ncbi:MAG: hypothetical protein CMN87_12795 [Stappia sp.]|uniref:cupin domain-containing protein n=1 Tax=Stappia sp. TaxID=1870903 RepID=UPI000C55E72A|nr:ectoine synthase [Stappia sp.]MAA98302.1 hypothetical protein [Stappia sp.]MBM20879.1 hypothetical protein [Stappia sp.]
MIVRTLKSASTAALFRTTASREVVSRGDQMGHAVFDTQFAEGATDTLSRDVFGEFPAQAHYCLSGTGVATIGGRTVQLGPDVLVVARASVPFGVRANEDLRLCSVLGGSGAEEELPGEPLVRRVADTLGTPRDVFWGNGQSRRLLVKSDGFGFALCQTLGNQDTDSPLQYRNHFESCYYVQGSGKYVWESGSHPIDTNGAGATAFIMNRNDAHRMVVDDPSICISVFSPAIEGHESHDFSAGSSSSY